MNSFVTIRLLQLRYDETRFNFYDYFFLSITIFQEDEQKLRTIN